MDLEELRRLWDAAQNEMRGVGLDRAGNFCSPPAYENLERAMWKHFPSLLEEISAGKEREAKLREALAQCAAYARRRELICDTEQQPHGAREARNIAEQLEAELV